ncbi:MAG TPA: hypothetical protein VEQ63_04895, partial [Bryobacteraceae bacterium]|nr:hypothetical protein [Bryobacteraceae bacterium]
PADDAVMWPLSAVKTAEELMRSQPLEAVISTFPPVNTHLTASILHARHQIPWIADFRDPLAANPFRKLTGFPGVVDTMLERRFFRQSSSTLAVSDVVCEDWKARYPQYASKFHLLWNGYDPEEDITALPLPPRSKRVISHVGSLYGSRNPTPLLSSLDRLMERGRVASGSACFRLVGELDKRIAATNSELFERLERRGSLELVPNMPRAQALDELRLSDYLFLVDISERKGYTVPAKIFEYLRVGRPILTYTDEGSPVDRILAGSGVPSVVVYRDEPGDSVDQKVESFLQLSTEPRETSEWFRDQFDGRRQTAALAKILEESIRRSPRAART